MALEESAHRHIHIMYNYYTHKSNFHATHNNNFMHGHHVPALDLKMIVIVFTVFISAAFISKLLQVLLYLIIADFHDLSRDVQVKGLLCG